MTKQEISNLLNSKIFDNLTGEITPTTINNMFQELLTKMLTAETFVLSFDTFADLQEYSFETGVPVEIHVLEDENKNQQDTSYVWTGRILKWRAEVTDVWQPTLG